MVLIGTLVNTITVAVGSSLGLIIGKNIGSKAQTNIVIIFGLFTIAMSIGMMKEMHQPIDIFLSLVIGALIGEYLQLHKKFEKFASRFNVEGEQSIGGAFIKATILFCVGGMTLIGCMKEGLDGDYNLIMVKSVMDLISSFFLASALGRGVLFSTLGVLLFQGALTLGFYFVGSADFLFNGELIMSDELIVDLTATGGVLLLALGLDLIGLKKFKMLDLVPALAILPFIHFLHTLVI